MNGGWSWIMIQGSDTHPLKKGERVLVFFDNQFPNWSYGSSGFTINVIPPAFYTVRKKRANHVVCQHEFDVIGYTPKSDFDFKMTRSGDISISGIVDFLITISAEYMVHQWINSEDDYIPMHKRKNPFDHVMQSEIRRRHSLKCRNKTINQTFKRQM